MQTFSKVQKLGRIFEHFEKSRKIKNFIQGAAPALRVIRAGTWLTVHRSLPSLGKARRVILVQEEPPPQIDRVYL